MRWTPRSRRKALIGRVLLALVTFVSAIAFLTLAVGPHVFGYRTLTMLSGSMRPLAAPGDLLVVRPEPVRAIRVGQVLAFTAPVPGSPVVSHRVESVEHHAEGVVIRTHGLSNDSPDPWRLRVLGDTAWYVVAVVPKVGTVLAALHRPVVRVVAVWILPTWLCIEVLSLLWSPLVRVSLRGRPDRSRVRSHTVRTVVTARYVSGVLATLCAIVATQVGTPAAAVAAFRSAPTAPWAGYGSATLQPPGSVTATCTRAGGPTATATITWTPSASTFATGYTISWTGASQGSTTAAASPLVMSGFDKLGDYTFTVIATYRNWKSTARSANTTC